MPASAQGIHLRLSNDSGDTSVSLLSAVVSLLMSRKAGPHYPILEELCKLQRSTFINVHIRL